MITLAAGIAGAVWQIRHRQDLIGLQSKKTIPDVLLLYMLVAIMAFWSSFGPDAGLYQLFYKTIPIFTFMRAPGRFGILVVLALIVMAAPLVGSYLARVRHPFLATTALVMLAAAELFTAPLTQLRDAEPLSPVYRTLATLPYAPVAEFPFWYERSDFPRHAYYMLNSTSHWLPLVNGYSDHIPQDFRNSVRVLNGFPTRESFSILGRAGVRYVVFHLDFYDRRSEQRLMERLEQYAKYLRPLARDEYVWLYEIIGWPN
jgi:hypothetical protein